MKSFSAAVLTEAKSPPFSWQKSRAACQPRSWSDPFTEKKYWWSSNITHPWPHTAPKHGKQTLSNVVPQIWPQNADWRWNQSLMDILRLRLAAVLQIVVQIVLCDHLNFFLNEQTLKLRIYIEPPDSWPAWVNTGKQLKIRATVLASYMP